MTQTEIKQTGFDTRAFRNALGCFGTGVCLITTRMPDGTPRGITANSFSSVSLEPPLVLWSIDESSDRFDIFVDATEFSIHVLSEDQRDLSDRFANAPTATFKDGELTDTSSHQIQVAGALAHFHCQTAWRQKAGDHVVIFGRVQSFASESQGTGLGYFRGQYTANAKGSD